MKILLTIIFVTLAFTATAQLSTNQKTQVTSMISTAIAPLKVEIKWLRTGKTADSLNLVKTNALVSKQALTIDSLRRVMPPPPVKYFIGSRMELINDTINTKQ